VASPGFGVRGHDDRGAEGASIEAPKAPSGVEYGEGCPLPSRLGGLGERHELPSRTRGGAPVAVAFSAYFRPQNASDSKKNIVKQNCLKNCKFHVEKVVVTVTTTFKSGGEKSPSSHTKLRLCILLFVTADYLKILRAYEL